MHIHDSYLLHGNCGIRSLLCSLGWVCPRVVPKIDLIARGITILLVSTERPLHAVYVDQTEHSYNVY